jgi:hypothetical protein
MFPRTIECLKCGATAAVTWFGPVHLDTVEPGTVFAQAGLKNIELTLECPECGTRSQTFEPSEASQPTAPRQPGRKPFGQSGLA